MSYPKELNYSVENGSGKNITGIVSTTRSLIQIIKKPQVLKIVNTAAIHTAFLQAVKDYIQPLMVSVAVLIPVFLNSEPEKKNGVVIGGIYFLIYLATSLASKYASKTVTNNKFDVPFITLLFGFILGFLTGVFYSFELQILALFSFVGIYLVENVRKPVLTGYISDNVPNEILASVISAQSLLKTIFTAILALVFGILTDKFGIGISFVVVSFLLALFSILIFNLKRIQSLRKSRGN